MLLAPQTLLKMARKGIVHGDLEKIAKKMKKDLDKSK